MTETSKPIITEVGLIYGRDAIFLHNVNFINEFTFELTGEFNGSLCANLENEDMNFKILFNDVHLFKMLELDFDEFDYVSSFDLVENSSQIQKMIDRDLEYCIRKIDTTYNHYIFRTYDTVFEIIGKYFELKLL